MMTALRVAIIAQAIVMYPMAVVLAIRASKRAMDDDLQLRVLRPRFVPVILLAGISVGILVEAIVSGPPSDLVSTFAFLWIVILLAVPVLRRHSAAFANHAAGIRALPASTVATVLVVELVGTVFAIALGQAAATAW